ncbi:hypothetical protein FisN_19Lh214 [Fistulifera solaris]|uniref:Uncharacterized protein n=1 Tax=Fistulifera solaris TaxID=1519565 RepID=A0A1Z5J6W8_FISSO|nr:hypothetical protein FisN_19Lh214 [Fistulifera solaris]|eukprot:GAX09745.1 hypothetical protein FisN_19Lh214 [Fistulifera solaris]
MMQLEGNHLSLVYKRTDSAEEGDFLQTPLCRDHVTSLSIEIRKNDHEEPEASKVTWNTALPCVYTAFPALTSLSLTCFFDHTGKHALTISELADMFQHCPNLTKLHLHGVGLSMEPDHGSRKETRPFEKLKKAAEHHCTIVAIDLDEIYFVQQNRADSWLFYSQLVQAVSASPNLSSLSISSTTAYFSRPILTLSALLSMLSHDRLQRLSAHHFNLWGAGSALYCAEAIRRNTSLKDLALTACVFAAAEHHRMGDDEKDTSSLLSGLDSNRSIERLDLTASMLPLEVSGLSAAFLKNESLKFLILAKTRMAFDPILHGARLCRMLKSISGHPCIRELNLVDTVDTQFLIHNGDENVCDSSMEGLRVFFHAVRDLVSENLSVAKVSFDPVVVEYLLESKACTTCAAAICQIGISTGLNRAQYWDLAPETSSLQQWVDALARISDGNDESSEDVLTSTIYQIVSSNPLVCSVK